MVNIVIIWLELEGLLDASLETVVVRHECFVPFFEKFIWIEGR